MVIYVFCICYVAFGGTVMKKFFGQQSKQVTDLNVEIMRLMFDSEKPIVMSNDNASFMVLMSAFHNYEKVFYRI